MVKRYVICGLRGTGKSTWVREHATTGALIWDLDLIAQAMGFTAYPRPQWVADAIVTMRAAVVKALMTNREADAYVIVSDPPMALAIAKQIGAEFVHLMLPLSERAKRIKHRDYADNEPPTTGQPTTAHHGCQRRPTAAARGAKLS